MKKLKIEEVIKRMNIVHKNKYDYSKINYINSNSKVCIICPEHGEFWQRAADHLRGYGCAKCADRASDSDFFIKKSYLVHGNNYDYSLVNYSNSKNKIKIICHKLDKHNTEHGEFLQRPNDHLNGYGCPKCGNEYTPTNEEWIANAKYIHGDKYNYSKVKYIKALEKICIICPKHGEFWQTPANHLNGNNCPLCNSGNKSKMEESISLLLDERHIDYVRQKTFIWLKYKRNLFLDFYIPNLNLAIEVQGEQHFIPVEKFGGENDFRLRQIRDKFKYDLCCKHNINVFYIRKKMDNINELLDILKNEPTN